MMIRDALKEELPFIRTQRIHAYSEHEEVLPTEHWQALKEVLLSDDDTKPGVELIAAELDGEIVGSAALAPPTKNAYDGHVEEIDCWEIRMLAVAPEARGHGIGAALVSECIERAKEKGCDVIGLHTGAFMKNAMKLYEKFDFKRIPEHDFEPANDGIIVKAYQLPLNK